LKFKTRKKAQDCDCQGCNELWDVVSPLDSYLGRRFGRSVKLCRDHLVEANAGYDRPGSQSNNCGHYTTKESKGEQ